MNYESISAAIDKVSPFLRSFLIENEILSEGSSDRLEQFVCPNPDHDDTAPSANLVAKGTKAYCHGCKQTFDIFHINHWLNNVPMSGAGFVFNNLQPLCEKYEVDFSPGSLNEEQKFKMDSYRAYALASSYISNQLWSKELESYINSRGLNTAQAKELGIGVVSDYANLYSFLRTSFSDVFLKEIGFNKRSMFSPYSVVFSIKDDSGTPVGFISRNINHTQKLEAYEAGGRRGVPPRKYDSSPERNRIFYKKSVLFGLDKALKENPEELYVFEGQFDWAIAQANGLKNSVALSGTALTPDHLRLLRKHKISSIVLVLDDDNTGNETLKKLLLGDKNNPGILSSTTFLRTFVLTLPDGHDPNSYIVEHGFKAFSDLEKVDSFQWCLNQYETDFDPLKISESMIPFILREPNHISRESMILSLSEFTGLSVRSIEAEVTRREDLASADVQKEKEQIVEEALREFQYGAGEGTQILRNALERIETLDIAKDVDTLSIDETVTAVLEQIEKEESLEGPQGFKLGRLSHFEHDLNGEIEGVVIAIGGVPNTGKTAVQSQLAKELIENNEDVVVIVQTIDDTRAQFIRRLVVQIAIDEAIRLGLPLAETITLNKIANPKFYEAEYPTENKGLSDIREFAYKKLLDWIKTGRLHIKDTTHGANLVLLERLCKKVKDDNPGKKIVAVLDNFHKTQDFANLDERSSVKRRSQFLKTNIAQGLGITVISTFEYKKVETGKRPTNNDLRDAVNIEYDINYLCNMYSPLKAAQDTGQENSCDLWHGSEFSKMPIVEGGIGKNKITAAKNTKYFLFYPSQSRFECLSAEEVEAVRNRNRSTSDPDENRKVIWKRGVPMPVVEEDNSSLSKISSELQEVPF